MAHWAEIDENNLVLRITKGDNDAPEGDEGYSWLVDNLGGTWIKTSYNATIRKNYAGTGYSYDSTRDAFIPPKSNCHIEEILDEATCRWVCINEEHNAMFIQG